MAQETRNVDYESMVDKYMNEWEGCNLREFCFNEKVNIYRMLKKNGGTGTCFTNNRSQQ